MISWINCETDSEFKFCSSGNYFETDISQNWGTAFSLLVRNKTVQKDRVIIWYFGVFWFVCLFINFVSGLSKGPEFYNYASVVHPASLRFPFRSALTEQQEKGISDSQGNPATASTGEDLRNPDRVTGVVNHNIISGNPRRFWESSNKGGDNKEAFFRCIHSS